MQTRSSSERSILYSLALSRAPGIGATHYKRLIDHFKTAESVYRASQSELIQLFGSNRRFEKIHSYLNTPVNADNFHTELSFSTKPGHSLISYEHPDYPQLLKAITDPPPMLYLRGDSSALTEPQLAIVGSRNAKQRSLRRSHEFAQGLCSVGITVTSGLAVGVDHSAHLGALSAKGSTIAVLGNGLNSIYPRQHLALGEKIVSQGGLLLSEQPPNAHPAAANFPKRNRIISGLSLGVLVIDATIRSGSLVTARLAAEQGRDVFALPGDIDNPNSKGCHRLIKDGAQLTETIDEILQSIAPQLRSYLTSEPDLASNDQNLTESEILLMDAIGDCACSADQLSTTTRLTSAEVSSILLSLELAGIVCSQSGGKYSKT